VHSCGKLTNIALYLSLLPCSLISSISSHSFTCSHFGFGIAACVFLLCYHLVVLLSFTIWAGSLVVQTERCVKSIVIPLAASNCCCKSFKLGAASSQLLELPNMGFWCFSQGFAWPGRAPEAAAAASFQVSFVDLSAEAQGIAG
jgi:hypothetical protein